MCQVDLLITSVTRALRSFCGPTKKRTITMLSDIFMALP